MIDDIILKWQIKLKTFTCIKLSSLTLSWERDSGEIVYCCITNPFSHALRYLCKVMFWFLPLPSCTGETHGLAHKLLISFHWILSKPYSVFPVGPQIWAISREIGPIWSVFCSNKLYRNIEMPHCLQPGSPLGVYPYPVKHCLQPTLSGFAQIQYSKQGLCPNTVPRGHMRLSPSFPSLNYCMNFLNGGDSLAFPFHPYNCAPTLR